MKANTVPTWLKIAQAWRDRYRANETPKPNQDLEDPWRGLGPRECWRRVEIQEQLMQYEYDNSQTRGGKSEQKLRAELLRFLKENPTDLLAVTRNPAVGRFVISRVLKRRLCRNGHALSRGKRSCLVCRVARNQRAYVRLKRTQLERAAGKEV